LCFHHSPDTTGVNFCYISGIAIDACRDVQLSTTQVDSVSSQAKLYSYEACSTPNRDHCRGLTSFNYGDGDIVPPEKSIESPGVLDQYGSLGLRDSFTDNQNIASSVNETTQSSSAIKFVDN